MVENLHDCQVTSPATYDYNCFAWAVGESDVCWAPNPDYYWPDGLQLGDYQYQRLVEAFVTRGFAVCDDDTLELGVEKIAIFADGSGEMQHASRQLTDGQWTSKIGDLEDITHESNGALEGQFYGLVVTFMCRQRPIVAQTSKA